MGNFHPVAEGARTALLDTSHQKWSEWKTNWSAVIAGQFTRKLGGGGGGSKAKR